MLNHFHFVVHELASVSRSLCLREHDSRKRIWAVHLWLKWMCAAHGCALHTPCKCLYSIWAIHSPFSNPWFARNRPLFVSPLMARFSSSPYRALKSEMTQMNKMKIHYKHGCNLVRICCVCVCAWLNGGRVGAFVFCVRLHWSREWASQMRERQAGTNRQANEKNIPNKHKDGVNKTAVNFKLDFRAVIKPRKNSSFVWVRWADGTYASMYAGVWRTANKCFWYVE